MKRNRLNSILDVVIGLLIVTSLFLGYQWYQEYYGESYRNALSSELDDKCSTPAGYTNETWKEHMGHHPDRYAECLGV
ncbi:MAG: hypothetical protein HYW24_03685 [Candidatus Aenigmarchaeota archaeon]|nr:hypothetical protein [Candidatus Aenigmarchaeota archaeon]